MASEEAVLHYFDGRGKAELIRMLLCAAKIKYREESLTTAEDMDKLRNDGLLVFKAVPLLQIDGRNLVQTNAIVHYLARRAGMAGSNEEEVTKLHLYYEGTRDLNQPFMGLVFQDSDKILETARQNQMPKFLPIFENLLAKSGTGYLLGDRMSFADVALLEPLLTILDYFTEDAVKGYPAINKFLTTMKTNEGIQHYLQNVRKSKNDADYVTSVKTVLRRN